MKKINFLYNVRVTRNSTKKELINLRHKFQIKLYDQTEINNKLKI